MEALLRTKQKPHKDNFVPPGGAPQRGRVLRLSSVEGPAAINLGSVTQRVRGGPTTRGACCSWMTARRLFHPRLAALPVRPLHHPAARHPAELISVGRVSGTLTIVA
jgi:hypothetical protein